MLDFVLIAIKSVKKDTIAIYPKFVIKNPSADLMIRGGDFYAVWIEKKGMWSTSEQDLIDLIDNDLAEFKEKNKELFADKTVNVLYLWDAENGMIDRLHKFFKQQMRDYYKELDQHIVFKNTHVKKEDYISKKLPYSIKEASTPYYDKIISTLYLPSERHKIEWCIGAIINGASTKLQKFLVFYGGFGTGKGTILKIIDKLFEGYVTSFNAKTLGSSNASFALEQFKNNPLVAIDYDGNLSKIEDNSRLNALVSHEPMMVNEKFKSSYTSSFKCFLIMGSNSPVKITDSRSGLLRRLIDVNPSGKTIPTREYDNIISHIDYELGGIAYHCREVFEEDPTYYNDYRPMDMMTSTNIFYNFMVDMYSLFNSENKATLQDAFNIYKRYLEDSTDGRYLANKMIFRNEFMDYWLEYKPRDYKEGIKDDTFYNLDQSKFSFNRKKKGQERDVKTNWIFLQNDIESNLDIFCAHCQAQYATGENGEKPETIWAKCKTTLMDIDTRKIHFVRVPENLICIDFDIKDENGNKDINKNLKEANKMPPTYCEVSKSGGGLHLHYIYDGDVKELAPLWKNGVEIKVYSGKAALRRRLTSCNDLKIAEINSGLPLKKKDDNDIVNYNIKSEKSLRKMIQNNLLKIYHAHTAPSVSFIEKLLHDAYISNTFSYDLSDMRDDIYAFASSSTNQKDKCKKQVEEMKFKSKDKEEDEKREVIQEKIFDEENRIRQNILDSLDESNPIDSIKKVNDILLNAYNNGVIYDVSDLSKKLIIFSSTTGKSKICLPIISNMKFKSEEEGEPLISTKELVPIVFFDCEVFPNLFVVAWKFKDAETVTKMINPPREDVKSLFDYNLIGFNCRKYDNHILYGWVLGYNNYELFKLSQNIIENKTGFFREAYNISYTDILDFSSVKKSLKKFEIDLKFHHDELGYKGDGEDEIQIKR